MDDPNNLSGHSIRGYQLLERIGAGGFGAVYRAYEGPPVTREVAIKIILPQYANHPDFIRRFEAEAQIVARLEHMHIVPLYKYWREPGGEAYLVMRYLPNSLRRALQEDGPWSAEATARLLDQIAAALMVAHRNGVVHRDIKPDNILLDSDDNAYLADFGLAKVLERTVSITQSGAVVGSLAYLSPEQVKGETTTPLADIYSLGLVLYETLTGTQPYTGNSSDISPTALMYKHVNEPLPSLRATRPDLPEAFDKVLQRATAKGPTDRFPNALSMATEFRRELAATLTVPQIRATSAQPVHTASPEVSPDVATALPEQQPFPDKTDLLNSAMQSEAHEHQAASTPLNSWWARSLSILVPRTEGTRLVLTRAQIILLIILGLATLLVVLVWFSDHVPPTQIEVAVNPIAFPWIASEAEAFNQSQRTIRVRITQRDSIDAWYTRNNWSTATHPVAWIPEARFSLDYTNNTGLRYEVSTPSLASTSLVWGIFTNRAAILEKPIDWAVIQKATDKQFWQSIGGNSTWGTVKPGFALPCKSTPGLGVLLVAAANYHQTGQLTMQHLTDPAFQRWATPMIEAVPNFATLGQQPASVLAQNGSSVADFALLPEAEWLRNYNRIAARQPIEFAYPSYKLTFDMPFAVWSGPETSDTERDAARQFAEFLMQPTVQEQAAAHGLRPLNIVLTAANAPLFAAANGPGISLSKPSGTPIAVPAQNGALTLLSWFKSVRSC